MTTNPPRVLDGCVWLALGGMGSIATARLFGLAGVVGTGLEAVSFWALLPAWVVLVIGAAVRRRGWLLLAAPLALLRFVLRPMRLDHVLVRGDIEVREGIGPGSDHQPVVAELAVRELLSAPSFGGIRSSE